MNTLSAFHAAQRGDTSSAYGGCGCGCNECGEYAGDYGSTVRCMPWRVPRLELLVVRAWQKD
jgi:hypothetical protein